MPHKTILFVCVGNSARSQIAEALTRIRGGDVFQPSSAGSKPSASINPIAKKLLEDCGIDTMQLHPKSISDLPPEPFDFIISLCDEDVEDCPSVLSGRETTHINWRLPDPVTLAAGKSEAMAEQIFKDTWTSINARVNWLIMAEERNSLGATPQIQQRRAESFHIERLEAEFTAMYTKNLAVVPPHRSHLICVHAAELENVMRRHEGKLHRFDWWWPLSLSIAITLSLISSDFRQAFGLSPEAWRGVFIAGLAIAATCFCVYVIRYVRSAFHGSFVQNVLAELIERNRDREQ